MSTHMPHTLGVYQKICKSEIDGPRMVRGRHTCNTTYLIRHDNSVNVPASCQIMNEFSILN